MRIIRHGREHPEWKKRVTCGPTNVGSILLGSQGCGAVLEVNRSDLFLEHMESDKATIETACCICPLCQGIVAVGEPPDGLPERKKWLESSKRTPYR